MRRWQRIGFYCRFTAANTRLARSRPFHLRLRLALKSGNDVAPMLRRRRRLIGRQSDVRTRAGSSTPCHDSRDLPDDRYSLRLSAETTDNRPGQLTATPFNAASAIDAALTSGGHVKGVKKTHVIAPSAIFNHLSLLSALGIGSRTRPPDKTSIQEMSESTCPRRLSVCRSVCLSCSINVSYAGL